MSDRRVLCARCGSDAIRKAGNVMERMTAWLLRKEMVKCQRCGWKGHVVSRASATGTSGSASRRRRHRGVETSAVLPPDREPNLADLDKALGWPATNGSVRPPKDPQH